MVRDPRAVSRLNVIRLHNAISDNYPGFPPEERERLLPRGFSTVDSPIFGLDVIKGVRICGDSSEHGVSEHFPLKSYDSRSGRTVSFACLHRNSLLLGEITSIIGHVFAFLSIAKDG